MIKLIVSGGQTGADLGALYAAASCGVATGGWAPKGYMTEIGPRPALLGSFFGLKEHHRRDYPPRTIANIDMSDATLVLNSFMSLDGGSRLTVKAAKSLRKPVACSPLDDEEMFQSTVEWLLKIRPRILNVAGNRESKSPGIECATEHFIVRLIGAVK